MVLVVLCSWSSKPLFLASWLWLEAEMSSLFEKERLGIVDKICGTHGARARPVELRRDRSCSSQLGKEIKDQLYDGKSPHIHC